MAEDGTQSLKWIVPITKCTVSKLMVVKAVTKWCYSKYGEKQMSLIEKK